MQKIFIASDHAGIELKAKIISELKDLNWVNLGTNNTDSVDYPDYADLLCKEISNANDLGVLICGSGQGMAIRANKHKHIRAALCWSEEIATLARAHNNANVICLGARVLDADLSIKILRLFLSTKFEGGRHARRVEKLSC